MAWMFIVSPVHMKNVEVWTCCVKYFWSRLDRYIGKHNIIWSKMDKHAKCIHYFLNVFSQIKTQTWCFQIYSLWSWNMRWTFTRSSETVKQPVLFYALVWFSHAHGPHTLMGRGKSPFHPRSRCFVSAWVLDLRKNTGWFTVELIPFLWSIIYPANFDTFNGHLGLVPSGISPFLVFFLLSIRRYRIEYFALYAELATK